MKKFLAWFMVFVLTCSMTAVFAKAADETESEFERVLLEKGSLIVKEFTDCCLFEEDEYYSYSHSNEMFGLTDTLQFQTASILDVETGIKIYALRITTGYHTSKYSYGEAVGVMDADEIDGAIKTLRYIQQNISKMNDYSEVVYKASSGMEVGAYHSSKKSQIYVKVNSDATQFYSVDKIDSLIECFEKVSATLGK